MKNLYDLIPDGGHGCNKDLKWFIENSSDINEIFDESIDSLESLNFVASEVIGQFKEDDVK